MRILFGFIVDQQLIKGRREEVFGVSHISSGRDQDLTIGHRSIRAYLVCFCR